MADVLEKIIAAARQNGKLTVANCRRPKRMAKELKKHLPHHDIEVDEPGRRVVLTSRLVKNKRCSAPESTCASVPKEQACRSR